MNTTFMMIIIFIVLLFECRYVIVHSNTIFHPQNHIINKSVSRNIAEIDCGREQLCVFRCYTVTVIILLTCTQEENVERSTGHNWFNQGNAKAFTMGELCALPKTIQCVHNYSSK